MDILNLTLSQLKHAADIKERIAALEDELQSIVRGDGSGNGAPASARIRRNRMSAAGRARIIAAQKERWAKFKKVKPASGRVPGRKRTLSPAAKAKIAAAARARWAKAKASGRNSL